jgi:hypothetical protein
MGDASARTKEKVGHVVPDGGFLGEDDAPGRKEMDRELAQLSNDLGIGGRNSKHVEVREVSSSKQSHPPCLLHNFPSQFLLTLRAF